MSIETLQLTEQRLQFGVPLEDVFLSKFTVHPALLNVFKQTYDRIVQCRLPVTRIISLQGTLDERLELKEKVALCKNLSDLKYPPGAFLWVVRHYLGLLPTQILPKRINNAKFVWWKIGKKCERNLRSSYLARTNDTELIYLVINELLRLPLPNFIMTFSVLNFLRMLSVLPRGEPAVNKKTVLALVKYYSSCLFVRPFYPGIRTKNDPQYYFLLLYLILKWSDVQVIVMETSSYAIHLPSASFQVKVQPKKRSGSVEKIVSKLRDNRATQTIVKCKDSILRVIPEWYETCEFVKDSWSQTDGVQEQLQFRQKSNKQVCCCCIVKKNSKKLRKRIVESSSSYNSEISSEFSDNAEFLYDEYSRCNLIGDDYENIKDFDPYVKIDSVSKENKSIASDLLTPHRLPNDLQRAINKELKEKFSCIKTKHVEQEAADSMNQSIEVNNNLSLTLDAKSFDELPSDLTDSNKSLVSIKKIRSKLEFLRVFKSNLKVGRNFSVEKVKSEIKYQKM